MSALSDAVGDDKTYLAAADPVRDTVAVTVRVPAFGLSNVGDVQETFTSSVTVNALVKEQLLNVAVVLPS
jgi:hypothetical protein